MMCDVLALTNPTAFGRALRIKRHVSELATRLGVTAGWEVEVAAMLSQLGSVALPPDTMEKLYLGAPLTLDEQRMVARTPEVVEQLLGSIPRLEVVRGIIASYRTYTPRERDDEDADPTRRQVAAGARLLRVAADFDALESAGQSPHAAFAIMLERTGSYDPVVMQALRALCFAQHEGHTPRQVRLSELRVGMVLAEDVKLASGMLLAGRGYEVKASFVQRARNFRENLASKTVRVIDN
jgi:response regulator RpfG family c-di-GMP phosphodiesterase